MTMLIGDYEGEELRVVYSGVGGYDDDTGDYVDDVELEEVVLLGVYLDINTLPKRLKQELYELSNDIEWVENE